MEFVNPKELSLKDLEAELERVKKARERTEEFLNSLNSFPDQKIKELQDLKEKIAILKDLEKKEDKEKFSKKLEMRENNLNKAIQQMKDSGLKNYDPRGVKWDLN